MQTINKYVYDRDGKEILNGVYFIYSERNNQMNSHGFSYLNLRNELIRMGKVMGLESELYVKVTEEKKSKLNQMGGKK